MVYNIFMDTFSALADPTRRKIIEILASSGQLSATEICEKFPVSSPAISQHLKVLREASLVHVEKRAQKRIYRLNPEALLALGDWTKQIAQLWSLRFDALEKVLEAEKKKNSSVIERTSDMENQIGREINLTRIFDAPRELVFRAFTDARLLAEWFGPNMFTNPVCEVDARPGGAILIHMRGSGWGRVPVQGSLQRNFGARAARFHNQRLETRTAMPSSKCSTLSRSASATARPSSPCMPLWSKWSRQPPKLPLRWTDGKRAGAKVLASSPVLYNKKRSSPDDKNHTYC